MINPCWHVVPGQQKKLHDWCSQMVEATKTHGSDLSEVENPENVQHVFDEVFDKDESDEGITVEDVSLYHYNKYRILICSLVLCGKFGLN